MIEITIKIKFDDEGGYKGHGDNTFALIKEGVDRFMEIDLEGDGVIKKGWTTELVASACIYCQGTGNRWIEWYNTNVKSK